VTSSAAWRVADDYQAAAKIAEANDSDSAIVVAPVLDLQCRAGEYLSGIRAARVLCLFAGSQVMRIGYCNYKNLGAQTMFTKTARARDRLIAFQSRSKLWNSDLSSGRTEQAARHRSNDLETDGQGKPGG
jgi:hypothetical protein